MQPDIHSTSNQRNEKIIEMIDWTLEKYRIAVANIKKKNQQNEEGIIDNIVKELDKKRDIAINKIRKALVKEELSVYRVYRIEENTLEYVLYIIRKMTGR